MNDLERYIKATKNIVIKPGETDIEKKILKRISNLNEEDKKLIDEKFLDYLKKSNSRLYMCTEWILNNPGKPIIAIIGFAALIGIFYILYKNVKNSSRTNLQD